MSGEKQEKRKSKAAFPKLSFYDTSDIQAQADKAYSMDMPEEELNKRRRRDWAFILIGVPLLIILIILIALVYKSVQ
ncbi:MAG: hypothetical protein ACI4NQ_07680 [Christensenellales bacterium]